MSGHSKWSTIKRKKAAADAKRGKAFTRLLREIQVAAKSGGGNPDANPRLRTAIQAAKAQSVPNDNIDKAINRGTGDMDGVEYEEIVYEGYAQGGVAVLVKTLTDNRNRTASDIRHAFSRRGGSLGGSNSVAYMFKEKGLISVSKEELSEDQVIEAVLDAGGDEVKDGDQVWEVEVEAQSLSDVLDALSKLGANPQGEVALVADTNVQVSGDTAKHVLQLLDDLDEIDDVQSVTANFDIDDAELSQLSEGN